MRRNILMAIAVTFLSFSNTFAKVLPAYSHVAANDTIDPIDNMEDGIAPDAVFKNYADSTKNAMRFLLEHRHMKTGFTFEHNPWYNKVYIYGGLGMRALSSSSDGPGSYYINPYFAPLTSANIGIGKDINHLNSLRMGASYGKGWLSFDNEDAGLRNDGASLNVLRIGVEHLYDITSYVYGYRPSRQWTVSTIEGIGYQHSRNHTMHSNSFEGHLGLQFKYYTGAHGYIAFEPYFGFATNDMDFGSAQNYRKYVPFYGANIDYVYYLRNALSPEEREAMLVNPKYEKYLIANAKNTTLSIWRTPWFFESNIGLALTNGPKSATIGGNKMLHGVGTSLFKGQGTETSFSLGKWISPSLAFRATALSRNAYQYGNDNLRNQSFVGVRGDLLLNPLALLSVDGYADWDAPFGVNLVAGLGYGKTLQPRVSFNTPSFNFNDKYKTFTYGFGAQLWARISDDLRAYIEPRYSRYYLQNRAQRFAEDGVSINAGLQMMLRERRFREEPDAILFGTDTISRFFLGIGGGSSFIQKRDLNYNVPAMGKQVSGDVMGYLGFRFNHTHAVVGEINYTQGSSTINKSLFSVTGNYQLSLSDILTGYKYGRKTNLDLIAGAGATLYDDNIYPTLHGALKLSRRLTDHFSLWIQPSMYVIYDKNHTTNRLGLPVQSEFRPFETIALGVQYDIFRNNDLENLHLPSWLERRVDQEMERSGYIRGFAPFFLETSTGYYQSRLRKDLGFYGSTLDLSVGKWITPWFGVRAGVTSRSAIDNKENIYNHTLNYYQNYFGARVEAMVNVLGINDWYAMYRPWGINAVVGYEVGKYRAVTPPRLEVAHKYIEREQASHGMVFGAHLWANTGYDTQLFIEPSFHHQFVHDYPENTISLRAGVTMLWRDLKDRKEWEDPITIEDKLNGHLSFGLAAGLPIIQMQNQEYKGGQVMPINLLAFGEYHFNNRFAARLAYEHMFLRGTSMSKVITAQGVVNQSPVQRLWKHTYNMGFVTLDGQASLTELMSGHKKHRFLDIDFMAGPSLAIVYGETGKALEGDYKLLNPRKSSAHFAVHTGLKLTAHVSDKFSVFTQPSLYFITNFRGENKLSGLDFLSESVGLGSVVQTINVGVQYDFQFRDSHLHRGLLDTRDFFKNTGIATGQFFKNTGVAIGQFFANTGKQFGDSWIQFFSKQTAGQNGSLTKAPWFVEMGTGLFYSRPYFYAHGSTLDLGFGKWITPNLALRASYFTRAARWKDNPSNSEINYHQGYSGARLEVLYDISHPHDPLAQSRLYGLNLVGGLEFGYYARWDVNNVKYSGYTPAVTLGAQLWYQPTPDMKLFVEPKAAWELTSTYGSYRDLTGVLRAGVSMNFRDKIDRRNWEDPITIDDDQTNSLTVGAYGGIPIIQHSMNCYDGAGQGYNFGAFAEYHINNVWAVRGQFEHILIPEKYDARYNGYAYNIPSLDAQVSLTELMSGHRRNRLLTLDVMAGPGLRFGPDTNKPHWAIHTGAKLNYNIPGTNVGVFFQPSLYFVGNNHLANSMETHFLSDTKHGIRARAIQTFSVGLQYNFDQKSADNRLIFARIGDAVVSTGRWFQGVGTAIGSWFNSNHNKNQIDKNELNKNLGIKTPQAHEDNNTTLTPWFVEASTGLHYARPYFYTFGSTLDLGFGKWIKPNLGLRGSIFTREAIWNEDPKDDNIHYHQGYSGGRVEVLYDVIHAHDIYAQSRKFGVNLTGGIEFGFYARWIDKKVMNGYIPAITAGAQVWYQPTPDMKLFLEPKAAWEFTGTYDSWRDLTGSLRAGVSMSLRENPERQGWVDDFTKSDNMKGHVVLGAMGGFDLVQRAKKSYSGTYLGGAWGAFAEYHIDNIWGVRANFEAPVLREKHDPRYDNYHYKLVTLDAQVSLTELMSGHRHNRLLTLDVMAGPGLRMGPDTNTPHWAVHTGAKLTYNVPSTPFGVFFQPSLFFVGNNHLGDTMEINFLSTTGHAFGFRAIQTFNLGVQIKL